MQCECKIEWKHLSVGNRVRKPRSSDERTGGKLYSCKRSRWKSSMFVHFCVRMSEI